MKEFPSIYFMKITGNSTGNAFLKYIKIEQEEAANKLMDFWKDVEIKKKTEKEAEEKKNNPDFPKSVS